MVWAAAGSGVWMMKIYMVEQQHYVGLAHPWLIEGMWSFVKPGSLLLYSKPLWGFSVWLQAPVSETNSTASLSLSTHFVFSDAPGACLPCCRLVVSCLKCGQLYPRSNVN